jgi:hypothetical protein
MVISVKPWQKPNAIFPIAVTDDGMVMLLKFSQRWNAKSPMDVTDDGIVYVSASFPGGYIMMVCIVLSKRTPSMSVYTGFPLSTVIPVNRPQRNARNPIDVTEEGMVMLSKRSHAKNAVSSINVSDDGVVIVTIDKLPQVLNALSPINITDDGIVMLFKLSHS